MTARLTLATTMVMLLAAIAVAADAPAPAPADPNAPAPAAPADPAPEKPAPPPDLTKIKIDVKAGTITIEGCFCLKQGILDYLAVTATGHEYEAVLALNAKASLLHAGLLAIGAETGPTQATLDALRKDPPAGGKVPEKTGTAIRATVEWEADGKKVCVPAPSLLINRKTKKPCEDAPWIFTGSYFAKDPNTDKNVYMGDMDMALIGVFYQPSAPLNFSKDNGNAYDGTESGYEINRDLIPKVGTPCKFVLTLWDKPAEEKK